MTERLSRSVGWKSPRFARVTMPWALEGDGGRCMTTSGVIVLGSGVLASDSEDGPEDEPEVGVEGDGS